MRINIKLKVTHVRDDPSARMATGASREPLCTAATNRLFHHKVAVRGLCLGMVASSARPAPTPSVARCDEFGPTVIPPGRVFGRLASRTTEHLFTVHDARQ